MAEGGTHIPQYSLLGMWPYDCAINVFRALLSEVGLNRTIEAARHYNEAWGRAAVGIVKERLGQQASDLETIALTGYYVHGCTSMGHIRPLEIREGGAIAELFACPNPGMNAPPEMCVAMSHVMAEGMCQAVNPNHEFIYTHHMGNGDDCCRWLVKKKGSKFTLDNLGGFVKTVSLELPMEERMSFAARMVVMSQLFTFTSMLIDQVGSQRALELVVPTARQTGLRVGAMMKGGAGAEGDLSTIKERMDLLGSVLQQSGTTTLITETGMEREIADCSCKGALPEVCRQFEAVFDGVCQAINPNCEFSYDRMMSEGDSKCHWVIRKGAERAKEEPSNQARNIVRI